MDEKEIEKTVKVLIELNKRGHILFLDPMVRIVETLKETDIKKMEKVL